MTPTVKQGIEHYLRSGGLAALEADIQKAQAGQFVEGFPQGIGDTILKYLTKVKDALIILLQFTPSLLDLVENDTDDTTAAS